MRAAHTAWESNQQAVRDADVLRLGIGSGEEGEMERTMLLADAHYEGCGNRARVRLYARDDPCNKVIRTEEHIWVKFFTNASYRAVVPAVRVDSGSELFAFFETDVRKLEEVSDG